MKKLLIGVLILSSFSSYAKVANSKACKSLESASRLVELKVIDYKGLSQDDIKSGATHTNKVLPIYNSLLVKYENAESELDSLSNKQTIRMLSSFVSFFKKRMYPTGYYVKEKIVDIFEKIESDLKDTQDVICQ